MPLYEYVCQKCHKQFSEVLTVHEHDEQEHDQDHEKVQCPNCHSEDLEKVIEPFFAKTASKTHAW